MVFESVFKTKVLKCYGGSAWDKLETNLNIQDLHEVVAKLNTYILM